MTRRVLLVEIGTEAELPPVTPVAPRPPASWAPDLRPDATLPPPTGLLATPVADGALLSWMPSAAEGARSIVESAPDVDGAPGVWTTVETVDAGSYMLSIPTGKRWARVRGELNGRLSAPTPPVLCEPVKVADLVDEIADLDEAVQQFIEDLQAVEDLANAVAAQAAADAAALNARADDLRDDIDATIAEVSTLADTTDDLGTELTRVETESVERDTATTSTIALLGARNGAGTAFVLNANTTRVSPTETLAEWRNSIQGSFAAQSSRIDTEVQALQDADEALATTLATVQATANNAATKAELTSAQNTLAAADQALSERIDLNEASLGQIITLTNPSFESGSLGWEVPAGHIILETTDSYHGSRAYRANSGSTCLSTVRFVVARDQRVRVSIRGRSHGVAPNSGAVLRCGVRWSRADGSTIQYDDAPNTYTTPGGAFQYVEIGGEVVAPNEAAQGTFYFLASGLTTGFVLFDMAECSVLNVADRALATALSITQAEVADHGDTLTAHTLQLEAHTTQIADKASTSYVQSVEGTATAAAAAASNAQGTANSAASQASANLTAINGLSATAVDHTASINEIREVSVSSAYGNLVVDGGFEQGTEHWNNASAPNAAVGTSAARSGLYGLRLNANPGGQQTVAHNSVFTLESAAPLVMGFWYRRVGSGAVPNGYVRLAVRWYDSNMQQISFSSTPASTTADATSFTLVSAQVSPPSNARFGRINVQSSHTTGAAWAVDDVFVEPVNNTLAEALASYVLAMNAGGKFAGVKYLNDGSVSNAQFLFDNFDFMTEDGSFSIVGGRTITRSGGFMRVEGKPFGQNNEMVVWYGPEQSNLANCRRNNAISYETNTGLHYARGAMFSGTITNGGHSTGETTTVYTTGSFATNGGPIAVNASFSHNRTLVGGVDQGGPGGSYRKNTISAGSGATRATIELWRRIGSGSWQLVASETKDGVLNIQSFPHEPDVPDIATWNNTVSISYTDNAGGTQNRNYEVRLTNVQFQGVNVTGGAPQPAATNSRALGVLTSE